MVDRCIAIAPNKIDEALKAWNRDDVVLLSSSINSLIRVLTGGSDYRAVDVCFGEWGRGQQVLKRLDTSSLGLSASGCNDKSDVLDRIQLRGVNQCLDCLCFESIPASNFQSFQLRASRRFIVNFLASEPARLAKRAVGYRQCRYQRGASHTDT